ncbi:MAG: bifunctional 5,10-methylenetetrahydrofolate dehydrogenase/5,10-methenyltetrahydrofolate cyclohydrolase [Saprospiraceae bacterium]|nr:bifunctional 5,10-methylenetetrahydrofolate dehydrogenase/5,10-methenyltetrahydrofolate cyclohydrolase [Candidatus Opimibacter skivensis]MBL0005759.1 bifunctional 5,10-methylenetetrahydrofolate dehydrogenase/5,10-methenyltetrahydrofolate cyclohydrolase [Candidatus Opimibacter skivensis]
MQIIDGNALAQQIKSELREKVEKVLAEGKRAPHLAAVLIGDHPASRSYVTNKVKSCSDAGFQSTLIQRPAEISQQALLDIVHELNANPEIDGFIVQLPLPEHIHEMEITLAISPEKDVDGFHPMNLGLMTLGLPAYLPATPMGIMQMLERYHIDISGKTCCVIGRSNIVGTPISILLSRKGSPGDATVMLCHSRTPNIKEIALQADVLVVALGRPNFLKADMVKEGAVVIDVGINRVDDPTKKSGFRLVGDVDYEQVAPKSSYITPVPGGVGPMTVTSLLLNTWKAYSGEIYPKTK